MNSVWILTKEYNDYDQYGEYFVAVFKDKPTAKELKRLNVSTNSLASWQGVLDGKGRDVEDYKWFILKEVPFSA